MSALPPYSVRVSSRARRMQLKVLPYGKIEVVVPKRVSLGRVSAFVSEHQDWIRRHLDQISPTLIAMPLVPEMIHFPAINEQWQVSYETGIQSCVISPETGRLTVIAPGEREAAISLQGWLQQRARAVLPQSLAEVSRETGLAYSRVTVRAQRSRWGSCSSHKHINLNRALLFVSPRALRYLLIHELCHTVHMNHSRRYWALVMRLMPEYAAMESELRQAMFSIPRWALPGFSE